MGLYYAALGRFAAPRRVRDASSASRHGLYTSFADLVALRPAARDVGFSARQTAQSVVPGLPVRGSNTPSSEPRAFVSLAAGFDVPALAGHSGADREPKRIAAEPPPRRLLVVVDQRLAMFFGSRRTLKSVCAAEAAALCVWRALDQGAPVGGLVFNDSVIDAIEPGPGSAAATGLIRSIAAHNADLRAASTTPRAPSRLEAALRSTLLEKASGCLIIVVSDFSGHNPSSRGLLRRLARDNQIVAVCVYDPFLVALPRAGELVVAGGELQVDVEFGERRIRRRLFDVADAQAQGHLAFEREIGVPVISLSAAEETVMQMRPLLEDGGVWRTRR